MEIKFLISFIIGILNIFLGIVIYNKNRQSLNNIFYGLMCFAGGMWSIFMSFLWVVKDISFIRSFIIPATYMFAIPVPLFYLLFAYNFPLKSFIYPKSLLRLAVIFPTIFVILVITGILRIENAKFIEEDIFYTEVIFDIFLIFTIYFFGYVIWGLSILLQKFKKDIFATYKKPIIYLIIGTITTFCLTGIVSIIVPLLHSSKYDWLGPVFTSSHFIVVGYFIFFETRK